MTAHLDSQQKFQLVNENFHSHTRPMCMYGKVYYGAPLKRTCPNLKFNGPTPLHYQLFHTPAKPMIINEVTNIIFFFVCIYIFTPRFLIINCLDLLCLHFWPLCLYKHLQHSHHALTNLRIGSSLRTSASRMFLLDNGLAAKIRNHHARQILLATFYTFALLCQRKLVYLHYLYILITKVPLLD